MQIIDLAVKDLRQLFRDWKTALFIVIMPVIFTTMFGFIFGGVGGEEDPRLPVGFLDRDDTSISRSLQEMLDDSEAMRLIVMEEANAEELEAQVAEEELAAAVIVPEGYGEGLGTEAGMPLTIVADPGSNVSAAARSEVEAAAMRLASGVEIARLITQAYESRDAFPGEAAREQFVEESRERALEAWSDPTLTVVARASGAIEEEEEEGTPAASGFAHSSVGIMVQFVMSGLISAGEILVLERKSRALQRLLTTAISRLEIILGHFLAMFLLILLQTTLLIGFGQVALGVDYLRTPLATGMMMVTTSLWAASMGLLIGVLARSEDQVIIFSLVPMFILSALGGAWMPLEFTSETFQTVGHFLPTAWAIDGFENLVVRGMGLDSVLVPAAIVAGYALVFFVLAVWRFRFE